MSEEGYNDLVSEFRRLTEIAGGSDCLITHKSMVRRLNTVYPSMTQRRASDTARNLVVIFVEQGILTEFDKGSFLIHYHALMHLIYGGN